jgi:hypothetical protein
MWYAAAVSYRLSVFGQVKSKTKMLNHRDEGQVHKGSKAGGVGCASRAKAPLFYRAAARQNESLDNFCQRSPQYLIISYGELI